MGWILTPNEFWERLNVTPEQVAEQPIISRTLSKIGNRAQINELLQESEVAELRAVWQKIREMPKSRPMGPRAKKSNPTPDAIPMEAFCLAAGVPTLRFLGFVIGEALQRNQNLSKLIASAAHPDVTEKTVSMALDGDLGAAKLLHQHAGFLPMPKNSVVQIFGGAQIDARQQTQVTLPPVEDDARTMTERFNQRFLTSSIPKKAMDMLEAADQDEGNEDLVD